MPYHFLLECIMQRWSSGKLPSHFSTHGEVQNIPSSSDFSQYFKTLEMICFPLFILILYPLFVHPECFCSRILFSLHITPCSSLHLVYAFSAEGIAFS